MIWARAHTKVIGRSVISVASKPQSLILRQHVLPIREEQ